MVDQVCSCECQCIVFANQAALSAQRCALLLSNDAIQCVRAAIHHHVQPEYSLQVVMWESLGNFREVVTDVVDNPAAHCVIVLTTANVSQGHASTLAQTCLLAGCKQCMHSAKPAQASVWHEMLQPCCDCIITHRLCCATTVL